MPVNRIIAAATALVDQHGVEAMTMRAVAQHLGSGTATLYRHFTGRDELIAHVVDAVLGEVNVGDDAPGRPWQRTCETLAHNMFDVLGAHPHVASLMIDHFPAGPNMSMLRERTLAHLLNFGFAPPLAAKAWAVLARYVLGFGVQIPVSGGKKTPLAPEPVDAVTFAATCPAEFSPVPLHHEFSFGVELLITGLERQLSCQ